MARISFILFLVVAMPIGVHHLFTDPQVGAGFKFMHSVFTGARRAADPAHGVHDLRLGRRSPAACAAAAARSAGSRRCPGTARSCWRPALSLVMLGFGGAGGLINMSYQLDASIHNTQWITGTFHLIFGGAIVIMYFAIAYDLWPHLTGRALDASRLMRTQLWLWFIGMIVTTFPWHVVGMLGMPRRMAFYDYVNPALRRRRPGVASAVGGFILLVSAILLIVILVRGAMRRASAAGRVAVRARAG